MKSLIVTGLVGVILFGISAGVSWFVVLPKIQAAAEKDTDDDQELDQVAPGTPPSIDEKDKLDTMPVALRPEIPVTVEAVTELAQSIMKKEEQLIESEKRLKKEEKRIGLLFEDLRQERDELIAFSQKIDAKVLHAREVVERLKLESQALTDQKKALTALEKKTGKSSKDVKAEEINRRVQIVKSWFARLEPEQAANYLKEFANRGDLEFAARLIDSLEERQIAKVLAVFNDPPLVAQIVDAFTKNKEVGKKALQSSLR